MVCCVVMCYGLLWFAVLRCAMLCCVVMCYGLLWFAVLCCDVVMLCYAVLTCVEM